LKVAETCEEVVREGVKVVANKDEGVEVDLLDPRGVHELGDVAVVHHQPLQVHQAEMWSRSSYY
jgi:hypothetical protein